jgi:5-methyltetrahydropteroyltriglutamate--homocysteine methyltransferase
MLSVTQNLTLPTAITGSYPRPLWFDMSLDGRSFKSALGESLFREQYMDAVAAVINAQEAAGLDIVTDGDSRFDLAVGGKSWFGSRATAIPRAAGWGATTCAPARFCGKSKRRISQAS